MSLCPALKYEDPHVYNALGICDHCGLDTRWAPKPISEHDPHGTDPHTPGAKLDAGKILADLVIGDFAYALEEVAKVGTHGAQKYTEHGWISVPEGIKRYSNAAKRHYLKRKQGETHDPDSGLPHLAHEAWNVLAVLELMVRENHANQNTELD